MQEITAQIKYTVDKKIPYEKVEEVTNELIDCLEKHIENCNLRTAFVDFFTPEYYSSNSLGIKEIRHAK